jgi:CDP-paratose 2-epimerase
VRAFEAFHAAPRTAAVYNLGGGRGSNVSMLEAIAACERIAGRRLDWSYAERARIGDHRWWVSDLATFERDHTTWRLTAGIEDVLREIHDANVERWGTAA